MKPVYCTLLLLLINYLNVTVSACENKKIKTFNTRTAPKERITLIDIVEQGLRNETWDKEENPCYDLMLLILKNVRNGTLWSTWVWDSMQLPNGVLYGSRYQLGNFDECMRPPWMLSHPELRMKYCLADIQLTNSKPQKFLEDFDPYGPVKPYINTMTKFEQELNVVTWGVCMPLTCKSKSTSKFLKILYANSHLGHIANDPVITVESCQKSGPQQYSKEFNTFWLVMLTLVAVAILFTCCVNIFPSDSTVAAIVNAFCIKRNLNDLVKDAKDDIPVIHGMRVLSALFLIYLHYSMLLYVGPVGNALDVDKMIEYHSHVLHMDLVVDTFLLMSGVLYAKGLLTKRENPFTLLMKRYIRLIAPYALVIFYASKVAWHGGSGPIWSRLVGTRLEKPCTDNGWLGLLMINNYVKSNEMCYPVAWYVACDYQLSILGTVLFSLFHRDRRVGKLFFGAVAVLAVILPGLVTYWNNLHALLIYDFRSNFNFVESGEFSTYTRSHYRMGPYLIGLAMGYVMTVYKPVHYRNIVPRVWSNIIILTSFIVGLLILIISGKIVASRVYNPINEAIFASTNRIVWALAANSAIILSEYGTSTAFCVRAMEFVSWPIWVPFSRLSYGFYMVHMHIVVRNLFTARTPMREDLFTTISNTVGVIVLSFILSLLMWLFVQAPFVNLTNMVLNQRTKPEEVAQNGNGYTNLEKSMQNGYMKNEKLN